MLWHGWAAGRASGLWKNGGVGGGHWLVRIEWRPGGWLVCLCLLLVIFPWTIKSRSSLLALAHPGGPRKRAIKRLWYVGVSLWFLCQSQTSHYYAAHFIWSLAFFVPFVSDVMICALYTVDSLVIALTLQGIHLVHYDVVTSQTSFCGHPVYQMQTLYFCPVVSFFFLA